jgi:hypothetical protein
MDADSMNCVNHGTCWNAGAMFGGGEAQGKVETLALWTPNPWKASPHHDTLREQVRCYLHAATGHQLQICLGDHWQTKQVTDKHHPISLNNQCDKPAQPPWTDLSPTHKKKQVNKHQNWKLVHCRGGGGEGCWKHNGEGGRARSQTHSRTISKEMAGGPRAGGW